MLSDLDYLINYLISENKSLPISILELEPLKRRLLRSLMNIREPKPISKNFLKVQDRYLKSELKDKGIVDVNDLDMISDRLILWQGDITRLKVDAIVNAANDQLLGCFIANHPCIDNIIHSQAGIQLREYCYQIMEEQNSPEPVGSAKITPAFNLASKYIIHTVGPIVNSEITTTDIEELQSCYKSCLKTLKSNQLKSIAFCCISTGEYHFPNQQAAVVAIDTIKKFLEKDKSIEKVIFNVFQDVDYNIYNNLLS